MNILSKLKKLSAQEKAAIAYFLANIITKGLTFITIPIFTRLLSTSEMGVVTIYTSWQSIIYTISTLALTSGSLSVSLLKYKANRDKFLSANLFLSMISVSFFTLIYFIVNKLLIGFIDLSFDLIICIFLYSLFNPALESWYIKNRYEYKFKSVVAVTIISSVISIGFSVVSVFFLRNNTNYNLGNVRILSQNIITIIVGLAFCIYILLKGKKLVSKLMWSFSLKISLPLVIHSLAKNVLDISDRLMIDKYCGKSDAGIYGTIYTISSMSLVIWTAINASLVPDMFENLEKCEYSYVNKKCINILLMFSGISLSITLFAPEILRMLTTDEYNSALYIIPALAAGIYLTALYNIYGNTILYKEKSIYLMVATSIAAVINFVLNYIFIRKFGYIAAAYTTLVSFIVLSLILIIVQKHLFKQEIINSKYILSISTVSILLCLFCNVIYRFTILRYFIIVVIIYIVVKNRKIIIGK